MLVNKLMIEHGYMFVRSTNPEYLKYLMDLGVMPIVMINSNFIGSLIYGATFPQAHLLEIRPLTTLEIKKELLSFENFSKLQFVRNFSFKELLHIQLRHFHIDRNTLWKKY